LTGDHDKTGGGLVDELPALRSRSGELEARLAQAERALHDRDVQYRSLFESVNDAVFLTDNNRIIDCNRRALDMLGCTRDQLLGQSPRRFTPPLPLNEKDSPGVGVETDTPVSQLIECKLSRYDGSLFDAEVNLRRVNLGEKTVFQAIVKEITDLKRAEQSLRESENKFRVLAEKALVGIYLVQDGLFKYVNRRFAETCGYPIDEITDKIGPEETAFPGDWPMVEENMRKRLSGEVDALCYEFRTLTKDGEIRNVEIYSARIEYQDKPAILGTLLDITERKRAQEALRESEAKYRTLLESIRDRVYILDTEGCFTFVNDEIVERSGRRKEWFLGRHYLEIIHPQYRELAQRNFEAEMRGEALPPYEIIISFPGLAEPKWVEVNRKPLRDGSGIIGVLGVSRDITSRKMMEEELKRHKDQLEHKVEERTAELMASKEELEIKTRTLEEVNTALKVLLRQREEDKKDLEERFASNVRKLILPYVEKMKKGRPDPQLLSYISVMETNLNEIMSPFLHSVGQFNLTPRETQVASLIKDGKTTKEIAEIIGIAPSAVDSHRNNIRFKLNLNKRKVNLQMHLQTMKIG
jgi:PAS domain S-box-containing protein